MTAADELPLLAIKGYAWLPDRRRDTHDAPVRTRLMGRRTVALCGPEADHDPLLWPDPYAFLPKRFVDRSIGEFDLVPQGGGDPRTGHRCPGEKVTVALLGALAQRLARLDYYLPPQDLDISPSRVPARRAAAWSWSCPDRGSAVTGCGPGRRTRRTATEPGRSRCGAG
jgi:cytochrome P450